MTFPAGLNVALFKLHMLLLPSLPMYICCHLSWSLKSTKFNFEGLNLTPGDCQLGSHLHLLNVRPEFIRFFSTCLFATSLPSFSPWTLTQSDLAKTSSILAVRKKVSLLKAAVISYILVCRNETQPFSTFLKFVGSNLALRRISWRSWLPFLGTFRRQLSLLTCQK